MQCFTIGHSNHSFEKFKSLLAAHGVNYLLDVRSLPYSGYVRHFNREILTRLCAEAGIGYRWLGRELGAKVFQVDSDSNYKIKAQGLETIQKTIAAGFRVSLLCTEQDPLRCHRFLAIPIELSRLDISVKHIQADGMAVEQAELEQGLLVQTYGGYKQLNMFEASCSSG
ncbi:MAG: DUF488 domain-containing protein [Firmicutes bacterium]|nr:DUF488 domain-containing protein [Bacillota bacterium]